MNAPLQMDTSVTRKVVMPRSFENKHFAGHTAPLMIKYAKQTKKTFCMAFFL